MLCTETVKVIVQKGIYKKRSFLCWVKESVGLKSGRPKSRESDWMLCNEECTWERRKKKERDGGGRGPLYERGD
jgi:hypothetical protein